MTLPLAGIVDFSAEKARLEKEMARADSDIARIDTKLANADFIRLDDAVWRDPRGARGRLVRRQRKNLIGREARHSSVLLCESSDCSCFGIADAFR